jgi:glycosyltransferase involved in cell wall biosynthesis
MKIFHLGVSHPPKDTRIFYMHATALAREGHQVEILVPSETCNIVDNVKINKVIPYRINQKLRKKILPFYLYGLSKIIKDKPDYIQVHEPYLLPLGLIAKIYGTKVIYDAHEDYGTGRFFNKIKIKFFRQILNFCFVKCEIALARKMSLVIGATEDICERYGSKSMCIRNFARVEDIEKIPAEVGDDKITYLIYPGTISDDRGIYELIKLMEFLPDHFKLIVYGRWLNAELLSRCKALEGFKKCELRDYADAEEIYRCMKMCTFGFQLTKNTKDSNGPYPMKVFEYLATKTIAVISDQPTKRGTFGDDVIYADVQNLRAVADDIINMYKDDVMINRLKLSGYLAVERKFNWNIEKNLYLQCFK